MVGLDQGQGTGSPGKSGLRDLFPGYYPPSSKERGDAYARGLVSLDANALLDLYRFTPRARDEFFKVLETLRARLFVTHQAALEFHRNRISVVDERLDAGKHASSEVEKLFNRVGDQVREFTNRYQIDEGERRSLLDMVAAISSKLSESITRAGKYDLTRDEVKNATDSVLRRLEALLAGRVGEAMSEHGRKQALQEAIRRREAKVPPGYADKKGDDSQSAGDYFVWIQLISEAKSHEGPVLLVCNEKKEDWVRRGTSNENLGPRPELVLEMQQEAGSALHVVTVVGLLREAREYLGATISASTIREAESLPSNVIVTVVLSPSAQRRLKELSPGERAQFRSEIERLDTVFQEHDFSRNDQLRSRRHILRWSSVGRALFNMQYIHPEGNIPNLVKIVIETIYKRDDIETPLKDDELLSILRTPQSEHGASTAEEADELPSGT